LSGACSLLFQYAILWILPALVVFYFLELRRGARRLAPIDRFALLGAATAALCVAPLLVYKWARFHDPFFTKANPLPLVHFHLFGIPFYALDFPAFFSLPATLLVVWGAIAAVKQRGPERLALLCLIAATAFWVLFYEWLDPRFLLYAIPMVAFPLCRSLSTLEEQGFLSFRRAPVRAVAGWGFVGITLLYTLYDRGHPYAREVLPVLPRAALIFSMEPISSWRGNVTVRLHANEVQRSDAIPAFRFLATYYRSWWERAMRAPEADDLEQISRRADGLTVAGCGELPQDYFSSMRRELAVGRRLVPCGSPAQFALEPATSPAPDGAVIFSGSVYRLVRLQPR